MNAVQKRAWFIVGTCAVAVVCYVVLLVLFNAVVAFAGFGLLGLAGFAPLIRRGEKTDERDRVIARLAAMAAGISSYCTFIAGCMGVWFFMMVKGDGIVSIQVLPNIVVIGGLMFFVSHAVVTLVLYGRSIGTEHE